MTNQPLATCRDYGELLDALRKRSDALKVTRETIDKLAGLADRHASKLLAPVPLKVFGMRSLGPVLAVLGLKMIIVEDAETLAKMAKRITPRKVERGDAGDAMLAKWRRAKRGFRGSEAGKVMNAHWQLKVSPKRRSQIARKAARVRWAKPRARGHAADTSAAAVQPGAARVVPRKAACTAAATIPTRPQSPCRPA